MEITGSMENRVHTTRKKPYSLYSCAVPDYFNSVPMHWHGEFELNFIREGSAEFICGDERFISREGDIIITCPNVLHSIYPCKGVRQIYDTLVFGRELLGGSGTDRYTEECIDPLVSGSMKIPVRITKEHHYYAELEITAENIFSCARGNTPQLDMLLRSEIIRLFWILLTEAEAVYRPEKPEQGIRPALQYIAEHYKERITVKQLAASVHLSESYFMSRFARHVGLSTCEYISHFRIHKACETLIDTNGNILETALDCGFRNISNFNRQFRRIVGCSPSEYRKKYSSAK